MNVYLNTDKPLENYKKLFNTEYFVDKSRIIEYITNRIGTTDGYICVTRPRRFGKSSVVDMLGAYYSKAVNSKEIFAKLNISNYKKYEEYLNKYNVINISFNEIPENMKTYEDYIKNIVDEVKKEIVETFKINDINKKDSLSRLLNKTGEKFIFIIDEWDYIFNNNLFIENQNNFLEFLRNLLKDQPYVALCYMTGVLPIKKYSSGSALNMFDEHTMLSDMIYGDYFGFVEEEVKILCEKSDKISFEEISEWYNGYINENGNRLYNPRSVVKALKNKKCKSYWTNTGAMDEVTELLKYNTLEVRDDVIEMVSGEEIDITIDEEFRAGQGAPKNKEEIYSAMIVLGFLSYYDGYLKIPNKELMKEFEKALKDESFGYVARIVEKSRSMLKATIDKDTNTVEKILHDIHNSEIPILQYNDENSLACVLTLVYLTARDTYRVEREEKTGKGYADFTFHPRRKKDTAFIVELKKDEKPEVALKQIRNKEYIEKFKQENENKNIFAVAICYDSKEKEHKCLIEEL
ncbi:AAA family ATPase [uncultured Clostridium sp.]|uniref:AAA family ATPase n=1 Tax=uncultured Clostridium sp. TaxID=59620 RepID=UPI002629369F|nr:AAA family ATPase [uncultured Clostridium sp.]